MTIINDKKWQSLANRQDLIDKIDTIETAKISNIHIKNPNNPAQLISAKLIEFHIPICEAH